MSLLAVDYILFLDGLGLIILPVTMKRVYIIVQGIAQLVLGVSGIVCFGKDHPLWWFGALAAVLIGRYLLFRYVASGKANIRSVRLTAVYFSVEMYAYFLASMLVYYLHVGERCMLPEWGLLSWNLAFGTSVVLLWTLGGMGFMARGLGRPLAYALRVMVLVGIGAFFV